MIVFITSASVSELMLYFFLLPIQVVIEKWVFQFSSEIKHLFTRKR